MEALLKKRHVAFERLKREHANAQQVTKETPIFEINDRLQNLLQLRESFDQVQVEIENGATEEELPVALNVRLDYEKLFFITKGIFTRLVEETQPNRSYCGSSDGTCIEPDAGLKEAVRLLLETQRALLTRQAAASTTVEELAVQFRGMRADPIDTQLPSFSLPTFKGDRKQWASFKDIFISSVDKKNLTNALKLQLLMSHLEGEAKSLVSSYAITDVNYKEVWDTLVEQYDKPKFAVSALVQEFCDQPVIKVANLTNLRKLVSTSDEVIRQLKAMGTAYESRDPWLIHLIVKKLDENLRSQWAAHIVDIANPTFDELLKFLKRKCDTFETCAAFGGKQLEHVKKEIYKEEKKTPIVKKEINSFAVTQQSCPMCSSDDHGIYQCSTFKEISVKERREFAQRARLCFNCLRSNHCARTCPSKSVCRIPDCQQRHHTLLCQSDKSELSSNISTVEEQTSTVNTENEDNNQVLSCSANVTPTTADSMVIGTLPTAVVRVKGNDNQLHEVRALIDSGSQSSLITERCITRLGLKRGNSKLVVSGIASGASETTRGAVNLEISSRFDINPIIRTQAFVLSKLTSNLPCRKIDTSRLKCLESVPLADPEFDKPNKIDLILGADVFLLIIEAGKMKDDMGLPVALNSTFGWLVAGQVGAATDIVYNSTIISMCVELNIDKALRQFWEIEEINKPKPITPDEQKAIDMFQASCKREESGRFVVGLPFDETKPPLGESLPAAIHRLKAMQRKFARDPEFKKMYSDFMAEYLELGHMERIPEEEIDIPADQKFYFPHHAVLRDESLTTKLRVVFDGSCKTATGVSLNDRLLVGPKVTEDVPVVFTRFRTYAVAFTADAEKMYRQVKVRRQDTDYQRIVWSPEVGQPPEHYRLLTVTYGSSCAPYLAVESLRQAARDSQSQFPEAAERLFKNVYIDDVLSGANTFEEAVKLRNDIIQITSAAGFNLRKWSSNNPRLFDKNTEANATVPLHLSPETDSVKALGIQWYPGTDTFGYQLKMDFSKRNTKRQMLSDTARLFDPLGWIAPVIVRIKILYQSLWLQDLLWDDPLPAAINDDWNSIKTSLKAIEKIRLSRWIPNHGGQVQLLGFADASEAAYAAVVYARSTDEDGNILVSLVASKTKVAPIQQVTLPRLELNAAVLLTDLMKQLLQSLSHLNVTCYAWTDSEIVLGWLSSHPRRWKTYVANRTSSILNFLPRSSWNHVVSADNPADCASRGMYPEDLVEFGLWWKGPTWLYQLEETWKHNSFSSVVPESILTEQEYPLQCLVTTHSGPASTCEVEQYLLERFSSLKVSQRVLAWINRFKMNVLAGQRDGQRVSGELTPMEMQHADEQFARCAQQAVFERDIENLRKGEQLVRKSQVKPLFPFLDGNGTLRVGGRLQNSTQPFEMKHPIILPKSHRYTELLINNLHLENLHAGPTLLIATLNQKYWILGCQSVVRNVINNCVRCARWKAKTAKQLMGSLPTVRIEGSRTFENVGVDYAGPIVLKASVLRTTKTIKGYIAVFVCLGTKATHLEAVTDLSSNAFISALKRFCSRRGLPSQIWSDNGTNFVGADRQLRELLQSASFGSEINHYLSGLGVQWKFITPSAPHMGGIWESAVKSMKKHLRVVLGTQTVTYEDMTTILAQVEACMNSRPLCALSTSVDSCEALTPGHFVIGQPINLVPEPDVALIPENRLDRYQRLRKIVGDLWERFRNEYVSSLQSRNKWQETKENLQVADLVLVKNDNTPPAYWELARVIAVHPDRSGVVRNVTLQRGRTSYQRPVHKLVVLPSN